ncbi:SIS domain-containing protein [Saxibacter everestensis]|uniref:SIS domain-containing protein n=1 Tax=Saxibacter everestensis TaxID=2909229 RepID=A0ABY8QTN5_9MICO|nr:SIS domain-containing protein [Brevibacteriaceae bacterium ZFBP1038]
MMLGFDESEFLKQTASAVGLRPQIEDLVDKLTAKGFDNLFLIGAGGTYAAMWPYEHLAKRLSTMPVKSVIAAELLVTGDQTMTRNSVAIFTSVSGTTDDSLRAIDYCRERGVFVIAFTGYPESPIAEAADIALVSEPKTWPFDLQMLLFMTRLFHVRGEFAGYEKFADEFMNIPEILVEVARQAEPVASAFADAHKDTDYYFLVGGGNLWGFTYLYSMCILEEMQWLRTTRVHSAEFFHGSLELLEEGTSVILFQGEDETRALTDRVEKFVRKISKDVTVFDTKDYSLEGISPEFRGVIAPLVLDTVTGRVSKHLERVREHSLDLRRYYRVVEY